MADGKDTKTILSITHSESKEGYDFDMSDKCLAARALIVAGVRSYEWFETIMNAASFLIASAEDSESLMTSFRRGVAKTKAEINIGKAVRKSAQTSGKKNNGKLS